MVNVQKIVLLDTIEKVKEFTQCATVLNRKDVEGVNISTLTTSNDYVVNGKSILGILSLNREEPLLATFLNVSDTKVVEYFSKFEVK